MRGHVESVLRGKTDSPHPHPHQGILGYPIVKQEVYTLVHPHVDFLENSTRL